MKNMRKSLKRDLGKKLFYMLILLYSTTIFAQPCTFEDVVKETTYNVPYKKYTS